MLPVLLTIDFWQYLRAVEQLITISS